MILIIENLSFAFRNRNFAVETSSEWRILRAKIFFLRQLIAAKRQKFKKNGLKPQKKSLTRMEVKVNLGVYSGAAKNERHKVTEPNQALQRMNCIVTDCAPSSTLRANAVHR